ncbi:MAG: hypothetical protein HPY82_06705 [Gammaproteobacteria bacterium]|nr:hypothetical protein [Gammaproteobacteria bacterium]
MGKPSKEELTVALAEAGRMREQGVDEFHIAKCLLNHNYRLKQYEELYLALEHYIRSGQSDIEHGKLMRALEKIRKEDEHPGSGRA